MKWRLGPIGSSRSAYGQVSYGSGDKALREKILARLIAHCESCAQDVENAVLVIRIR